MALVKHGNVLWAGLLDSLCIVIGEENTKVLAWSHDCVDC